MSNKITVGVLALQGAFVEHIKLLRLASNRVVLDDGKAWSIIEVRTSQQLEECDALIIPGGESTTISLVAARTGLLEPLRDFVKYASRSPAALEGLSCSLADLACNPGDRGSRRGAPARDLSYLLSPQIAQRRVGKT